MKRIVLYRIAFAIVLLATCFASCKNKVSQTDCGETEEVIAQSKEIITPLDAVKRYLTDELGPQYASAEVCIPTVFIIASDSTESGDYLIWGDFWVFNYDVKDDTLKTVSGGNHPGLMHVERTSDGAFAVSAFDVVADGAGFMESAKQIFGDKYDAFQTIHSDAEKREELRKKDICKYVNEHQLPVTCYQDFGWPAISIP